MIPEAGQKRAPQSEASGEKRAHLSESSTCSKPIVMESIDEKIDKKKIGQCATVY